MTVDEGNRSNVAPTYLLTSISDFVDSITYRMLADGMILQDIRAAREVETWDAWPRGGTCPAHPFGHVSLRSRIAPSLDQGHCVKCPVELAIAATVEAMAVRLAR